MAGAEAGDDGGEDAGVEGAVARGEGAHDPVDLLRLARQPEGREERAHRLDEREPGEVEALRVGREHLRGEVGALAQRLTQGKETGQATGKLTLGNENQGDNAVRLRSNANGLAAALTRLLVASLRMKTPTGEIQAGRTAVTDAQVSTSGTPNMPSTVNGSVGQVEIQSLSAKHTLAE